MVSGRYRLLAVMLDDAGVARLDLVGVEAELPPGSTLAQKVPALVERFLQLPQAGGACFVERLQLVLRPQLVLFGHQLVDRGSDLVVIHRRQD